MNLRRLFLTNNECYRANIHHTVKGIMVHSTGANNPTLKRYVGPDDGLLGVNPYNNHWNTLRPGGKQVCVHAFIGKLKDDSIATYQTLPWDIRGWHSGSGSKGSANTQGYIGFEICEDGLTDPAYFNAVYREAVELCAMLCKQYSLNPTTAIICHSEGYKRGIASNHADVMHWFPRHGKSMDSFRADVAKIFMSPVAPVAHVTDMRRLAAGDAVTVKPNSKWTTGAAVAGFVYTKTMYVTSIDKKSGTAVIAQVKDGATTGRIAVEAIEKINTHS